MGTAHVRNLVRIDGCTVTAVCDIREAHAERAAAIIEEAGHPRPALYTNGETDFERLCAEADLDLVYTATPWRWHVPVCVAAMENGKHAATEVPAAYTLEDCWRLVEDRRADRPPLRDDGERQLRARRAALPEPGPAGVPRRDPARRVRVSARPPRHQVRRRRRGTLAPRSLLDPERQPLSHARARSGRKTAWTSTAGTASPSSSP